MQRFQRDSKVWVRVDYAYSENGGHVVRPCEGFTFGVTDDNIIADTRVSNMQELEARVEVTKSIPCATHSLALRQAQEKLQKLREKIFDAINEVR